MVVVPYFSNEVPYAEDTLNSKCNRNIKNTRKMDYNCGGYALGTFNWYLPCTNEAEHIPLGFETEEEAEALTKTCVKAMLMEFEARNLRVIDSLSCLNINEYAFAFRISSDGDFHYVRRHTNGKWFHKCGAESVIRLMEKEEVFTTDWCDGRYDGPIVLFAIHK